MKKGRDCLNNIIKKKLELNETKIKLHTNPPGSGANWHIIVGKVKAVAAIFRQYESFEIVFIKNEHAREL